MTALVTKPTKTYIADFTGCNSRMSFLLILARAFSVGAFHVFEGGLWRGICQRISLLAMTDAKVNVRIVGLEDTSSKLSKDCDRLISLLRTAKDKNANFNTEVVIGRRGWSV